MKSVPPKKKRKSGDQKNVEVLYENGVWHKDGCLPVLESGSSSFMTIMTKLKYPFLTKKSECITKSSSYAKHLCVEPSSYNTVHVYTNTVAILYRGVDFGAMTPRKASMAYSRRLELYFGRHPRLFPRVKRPVLDRLLIPAPVGGARY